MATHLHPLPGAGRVGAHSPGRGKHSPRGFPCRERRGQQPPYTPPPHRPPIHTPQQPPQTKYTLLCILFALKHTWQARLTDWESLTRSGFKEAPVGSRVLKTREGPQLEVAGGTPAPCHPAVRCKPGTVISVVLMPDATVLILPLGQGCRQEERQVHLSERWGEGASKPPCCQNCCQSYRNQINRVSYNWSFRCTPKCLVA